MKVKVKFESNSEAVKAKIDKLATEQIMNTKFLRKCPKCSQDVEVKDGMNICPLCNARIEVNLNIKRS